MKTRNFVLFTLLLSFLYTNANANLSKDWISYFGLGNSKIYGIEYDTVSKSIYIVGTTSEKDLGTPGTHQPNFDESSNNPIDHLDIFVAKFSSRGALIWFTYYGGNKVETNPELKLDKLGNVYISGYTQSLSNIASPGAFKTTISQASDFIAKLNPQGQRLWATYYNERTNIYPYGPMLAVDENNNVCMMGITNNTTGIATAGTHQQAIYTSPNGNERNAYLVKFDASGQRIWGSYFGGGEESFNKDIRIDKQNNIYITGWTSSRNNIASPGAMVTSLDPSVSEVSFLAKFTENGQRSWSTYIHDKDENLIHSFAVDNASNVYVFGISGSDSGIATTGAWQPSRSVFQDFFLMKLNSSGHKIWGTYYGGENNEGAVITMNGAFDINFTKSKLRLSEQTNPDIYVSGYTFSTTGIQKGCTIYTDSTYGGVLSKFDNNGQLLWGSYYDAPIFDFCLADQDSIFFAGNTERNNLGSSNAYQPSKPTQVEAGLFGKFVEHFVCPASFTVNFSKVDDTLKAQAGYMNYQWFRNDTLLQNGPQNYYLLTGSYQGVYKLRVLDPCNCIFNSDSLFVEQPSALKNTISNKLNISIAPNPARNELSLHITSPAADEYQLGIYDILGKKVSETTMRFDQSNKKIMDISNYSPGLYILKLESKDGQAIMKFIKQ